MEAGEPLHLATFSDEGVLRGGRVFVTQGNAACEDFVVADRQLGPGHLVVPGNRCLRAGVQAHVWVGGQERPAFLWQARTLSEAWNCPWTVEAGRHHFDVIDGLTDPNSALMAACLDGL